MMSEIMTCELTDSSYPRRLKDISDAPKQIYYKGNIDIINKNKCIAIVGSRNCSKEGLKLSYETAAKAVEKGFVVVNGLALGCDAEVLKGALAKKGHCVAVMPCGLEQIQPKSNKYLADAILENGGCVLSEYPQGSSLQKYNYVKRDRIQSGISEGVIIIEAEEKSGTMHTAQFALRQQRRLVCYASKLLELSSGNKYLEETRKAHVINNSEELDLYLDYIINEPEVGQMLLEFK